MEPSRELLDEQPIDQRNEQPSAIVRVEQYALPAFVWWVGGTLVLVFLAFVAREVLYILVLWGIAGLLAALAVLFVAAYRVYSELTRLYEDVQELLQSVTREPQPAAAVLPSQHSLATVPQSPQTQLSPLSPSVYDRDGVAIPFSEIFKEL